MSKEARKQKKQKQREQKNRQEKLREEKKRLIQKRQQTYKAIYPTFRYDTKDGDPGFVAAVRRAINTISFEDNTLFTPNEKALYQILKRDGSRALKEALLSQGWRARLCFGFGLGQAIIDRIPDDQRDRYFPYNDVAVVPSGRDILLLFRSLAEQKGRHGTVYYSRRKPTLNVNDVPKVVAFSRHAIDRICERLKTRWKTSYAALGDVFAFLDQILYFETCELHGGQLAFTFYDSCDKGFSQYRYVEEVLGEENLDPKLGRPYYRLGYCPANIEGDFIKARTLVIPGYKTTPEYDAVLRSRLTHRQKRALLDEVERLDVDTKHSTGDFSLTKWFHDHGVPQVVQLSGRVFDDLDYRRCRRLANSSDVRTDSRLTA